MRHLFQRNYSGDRTENFATLDGDFITINKHGLKKINY